MGDETIGEAGQNAVAVVTTNLACVKLSNREKFCVPCSNFGDCAMRKFVLAVAMLFSFASTVLANEKPVCVDDACLTVTYLGRFGGTDRYRIDGTWADDNPAAGNFIASVVGIASGTGPCDVGLLTFSVVVQCQAGMSGTVKIRVIEQPTGFSNAVTRTLSPVP